MHFLQNYLMFAGVVFLLMVPVFLEAFQSVEKNMEERAYREIVRGVSAMDDEVAAINNIIFRLRSNVNYSRIRSMRKVEKASDYYTFLEFRNYFADLTSAYTLFESPVCYFSNGVVVTPKTVYLDSDREGSLLYRPVGYDSQKVWLTELAKEDYSYQFLAAGYFYNDVETIEVIPYAHTYANLGNQGNTMFLILLPVDTLCELTGLNELKNIADITVVNDTTGEVLYSNHTGIKGKSSAYEIRSNQSCILLRVEIPKKYFLSQMKGLLWIGALYLLLFLLVAFVISLLLAWRNFKPIGKIISVLDNYVEAPDAGQHTGYEYIENSIKEIGESGLKHQNRYKKLNQEMEHWMLREQILNGLEGDWLTEFLENQKDFQMPFRLLVLQFTHTEWEIPSEEVIPLFGSQGNGLHFFSKVRPNLFVLIWKSGDDEQSMEEEFRHFVERAEYDFGCDVILVVSEKLESLEKLNKVYHAERYSMKYLSSQKLIFQEKVEKKARNGISNIDLMENMKLTDLILAGNDKEAIELVSRQWYQVSVSQTYTMIEHLYYMQAALLNNIAAKLRSSIRVEEMEASDNIPDMEQKMLSCVRELCLLSQKIRNDSKNELPKRIVTYIDEHYDNPDFYMVSLVEKFGISDKTIARMIKTYLNIGFSEYLEQLRIQKARILLENPALPIRVIASESGFSSENTFYKAFRRIYKVSPSDYRANLQHLKERSEENTGSEG